MSIHNHLHIGLISAAMEAIYQLAKTRVLDRYNGICPDGTLVPNEEDALEHIGREPAFLHAWHFDRPDAVQEEIYEECQVVAKEFDSFFDTEAYKAFDRLGRSDQSILSKKLLDQWPLSFENTRLNKMCGLYQEFNRKNTKKTVKKGGK